jgi:hypothetical protein
MRSFDEYFDCHGNATEPAKTQVDTRYCIIPTEDHALHEPRNVGRAQRLPLREVFGQCSRQAFATLNTATDVAVAHGALLRQAALSSVPPSRLTEFEAVPVSDQASGDLRRMEVRKWRL